MSDVNKIILLGRLGADPEVRYTQGGDAVCNLRMATSESWNDRDGNRQERTQWHRVTVWGKLAELCGQYLSKGQRAYIEGQIEYGSYTNNDGAEIPTAEIKVTGFGGKVVFLDGGNGGGQRDGGNRNQNRGGDRQQGGGNGGWGANNSQPSGNDGGAQSGVGWGGKKAVGGWGSKKNAGGWGKKPADSNQGGGGSGGRASDEDDPLPF